MNNYYVYSLTDPRNPTKPFYIGKGTSTRMFEHLDEKGDSDKNKLITEIETAGHKVICEKLIDNLDEISARKNEAQLISAFGLKVNGGCLLNIITPTGNISKKTTIKYSLPIGCKEKAQIGLEWLKEAIHQFLKANPDGSWNSDIAKSLGLESSFNNSSKNYVTYSVLGLLMLENKVENIQKTRGRTQYNFFKAM